MSPYKSSYTNTEKTKHTNAAVQPVYTFKLIKKCAESITFRIFREQINKDYSLILGLLMKSWNIKIRNIRKKHFVEQHLCEKLLKMQNFTFTAKVLFQYY